MSADTHADTLDDGLEYVEFPEPKTIATALPVL